MAVISKPVSADLRCINASRNVMQRFNRIKRDLHSDNARLMEQSVHLIQDVPVARTLVTVTSELAVEE